MELYQRLERDKHNTYHRFHHPMLLLNTKKSLHRKNISTNNTSIVGQIVKIAYKRVSQITW